MSSAHLFAALLAVLAVTIVALDEDFAFDINDDLEVEFNPNYSKSKKVPNELNAYVGHLFHFKFPNENLTSVVKYEAKQQNGKPLPPWLLFDKSSGIFWGLPLRDNIGDFEIIIKTSTSSKNTQKHIHLIVGEEEEMQVCPTKEEKTVLILLIDKHINSIKPKQRIIAINNIAKFFGIPYSAFTLQRQEVPDDLTDNSVVLAGPGNIESGDFKHATVLKTNVGCDGRLWTNTATIVHQLKPQAKDGTLSEVLRLPVIGWRVKIENSLNIRNKRNTEDIGAVGSGDYDDSYYDDYDDYDQEYDDYSDPKSKQKNVIAVTQSTTTKITTPKTTAKIITTIATTTPTVSTTVQETSSTHHHRHHHGQIPSLDTTNKYNDEIEDKTTAEDKLHFVEEISTIRTSTQSRIQPVLTTPIIVTTEKVNIIKPEDTLNSLNYDDEDDYEDEDDIESETIVPLTGISESKHETEQETTLPDNITPKQEIIEYIPETTPVITTTAEVTVTSSTSKIISTSTMKFTPTEPTTTIRDIITTIIEEKEETTTKEPIETTEETTITTTTPTTTTVRTTPTTTPTTTTTEKLTTEPETTTLKLTTLRHITTTQMAITSTDETIEYEVKNFPPSIQNRLKRIATTAGKLFSYIVPPNTFVDMEDGHNLILQFLDHEGNELKKNSWCQFNSRTREIYGLPLEEDISRWEYILKATDKEGASVSDRVEILVQHHKSRRVVNHEFSLYMHIEKKWEFPHDVDWSLKTLRAIGQLYHFNNLSEITVRRVNYTSEPVVFVWTNDSLPKSYCPKEEIDNLLDILTANSEGDPSHGLTRVLVPELRVKKVLYHGLGVCESKPQPPAQVPITPPTNFSPILRNPIDHIDATVGELLVFKVPDDTFYDPEDVDSRNLKMTLLTVDRLHLSPSHWLQFDSKNKEFYGIPLVQDIGRNEYQLVCEDTGGLSASDSLVVVVHVGPRLHYNVEFSMTIETHYDTFVKSASMQRKFIEKLRDLFGDKNTSYIHLSSISKGSTIISWYNKSLSTADCPRSEIKQLESILVNNDRTIATRVQDIMDPEFTVSTIKLQLIGTCKGRPNIQSPASKGVPIEEPPLSDHDDYLVTYIVPTIIIATMLFFAGIAACVLYRRRRTGKMNVEEDGRSSYGNKGIPVIFQEELEEKPEPGTKAPIILKDEKPPLAPPEYSKSGSLKLGDDSELYQPPPPFTRPQDNSRQSRPKPTPTYRKPPPYVPP